MMRIPAGKECYGDNGKCAFFLECCPFDDCPEEPIRLPPTWDGEDFYWERSPECRAAYPNGAVVTITAKEVE